MEPQPPSNQEDDIEEAGQAMVTVTDTRETAGPVRHDYTKRFVISKTTGRPNQLFICSTCNAVRPKLAKIIRHLNVHRKQTISKGLRYDNNSRTPQVVAANKP